MVTTNQKIYNTYTHKKTMDPNITLKIVIKSQEKRAKEEKGNKKELQRTPKQLTKWQ